MYRYTDFDRQFVHGRAAQFRDQLQRHLAGELGEEEFRALRLQNGWYVQRHAPMLRVAVPYGELSSRQLRMLARIAVEHDLQDAGKPAQRGGFGHFSTRQNLQFNWIPLDQAADVMDKLAAVDMHGIQTSGNCIRNITTDALAGVAADEIVDPRPYCEILRQWSTLHPEFAFLPRKFKIAVSGATEDRAASAWHDIGLQLLRNETGEVGFKVSVGGGMGRTPLIATPVHGFVPWQQILVFIEAIVRVYNLHGRRDNMYKARIKILVKAEGQRFVDAVNAEFAALLADDGLAGAQLIPQAELERVSRSFVAPVQALASTAPTAASADQPLGYRRWLERNVHAHQLGGHRAVTLSLKRAGLPPGDVTAAQMNDAADLADRYSQGELRVTHDQNLLLPWVREDELRGLWLAAREAGFATPNIGLLTDMIACPGGDLCALANARSIPVAAAITERFDDLDALYDIGDIDLHLSGCINSCGHHHSGHIGILGVDKDGAEWYQITLGGADGSTLSGAAVAGKVIGPAFAADEVPDVIEAVVELYRQQRQPGEPFIALARRLGTAPFRAAADAVRRSTARVLAATA
ncbi:MAG: nitrite/sulfite reductase [Rubrivivax sp.]|nr:nitrite/sulfite reductase [Rubrivivax sp.]